MPIVNPAPSSHTLRRVRRYSTRALLLTILLTLFTNISLILVAAILETLTVLAAVGALWWRLGPRRWWILAGAKRRAQLRDLYHQAHARTDAPGIELVRVLRITQRAKRGTKAIVRHPDGSTQDAWFWWAHRIRRRDVYLVRAHTGHGTHTHSNHVLYIGSELTGSGIVATYPRASWRAGRSAQK